MRRPKPLFFGHLRDPDTPMAVSNKGATPINITVWRGRVRTGQDWPRLKAINLLAVLGVVVCSTLTGCGTTLTT